MENSAREVDEESNQVIQFSRSQTKFVNNILNEQTTEQSHRGRQTWRDSLKKPSPTLEIESDDAKPVQPTPSGNAINTPAFKDHVNSSKFLNSSRGVGRNHVDNSSDRMSLPESKTTFNHR